MNCPKCNKEMSPLQAGEVQAKTCLFCKGLWFDVNALEKALEQKWMPADTTPETSAEIKNTVCPECSGSLISVKTLGKPYLDTLACTICQGRWIEASEFKKLAPDSLWQKFKIWLSR
ncbi:MAG: zf-TFIIB domain-containing protein [Planctomycetes bacterium]|nr:zf-TFIIB domain-containing protein [Planctomycetota bacterium]